MWVIVAKKGLDIHRDDLISTLLDEEKNQQKEEFVVDKKSSRRYNTTTSLSLAKIYKQEASCKRFVKKFLSSDKSTYRSPYHWIKDHHLSFRRITLEEWNDMCNNEVNLLNRNYEYHKSQIEKKRMSFK
jgi:hypothetical protein